MFGGKVRPELGGYAIAPLDVGGVVRAAVQVTTQGLREITEFFHVTTDPKLTWDMNDPAYRGAFYFPDRFEHIYWSAVGYRPEHIVVRAAEAYKNYRSKLTVKICLYRHSDSAGAEQLAP
ncbi:MAG: hypothetical protein H7318_09400 [Oligoflexus sp.]|nr:hypothetical protein [Oligoflexus sp.]